jgi:hypothetical protein
MGRVSVGAVVTYANEYGIDAARFPYR